MTTGASTPLGSSFVAEILRFHPDAWRALQHATNWPRANLIADFVGHPEGAPSLAKLESMNPSLGGVTIRTHLNCVNHQRSLTVKIDDEHLVPMCQAEKMTCGTSPDGGGARQARNRR